MTIGDRIKERRISLGLSADDVAKKLNKNRATIYRYESSFIEKMPTSILEPLAKVLQTTPAYLMGWEESSEPTNEDTVSDIFVRLRQDATFYNAVQKLYVLNDAQLDAVITMLSTFEQN